MAMSTGPLTRVFAPLRTVLSWCYVDKAMLIAALTLPFPVGMAVYSQYLYGHRELAPFLNWEFIPTIVAASTASSVGWLIFIAFGFWLRTHRPDSRAYVHLLHVLWYTGTVFMIYCYGLVTSPAVLQVLGAAMIGVLLWDLGCVLPTLVVSMFVLVGLTASERAEWIPYGPLLASPPFVDGRLSSAWLYVMAAQMVAIFGLIFALSTDVMLRWRERESQLQELNDFLRRTFGRYLSSEVMRAILADPEGVELGGQKRRVSIMMTDIRGFTQLSEKLTPEQVVRLINRYLGVTTEICDEHQGTVNDIAGDGVLVTFGAPKQMAEHAHAAVACAIQIQNAVESINRDNAGEGLPPIEIGIGLNTAEVVVGNIGSEKRSKYGVVGSGVNMASRIESYAVGGQVLASQSVVEEAGRSLRIDGAMEVFPKGAEMPLMIYELGGISGHYNVMLEGAPDGMQAPLEPVYFRYTVLSGKRVGAESRKTRVSMLSKTGALLAEQEALEVHQDLRLRLEGVSVELARFDFYAKVIGTRTEALPGAQIRFTSLPSEIAAYFEGRRHSD